MSDAAPTARPDVAKVAVLAVGAALTVAIIAIIVWSSRAGGGRADVVGRVALYAVVDDQRMTATVEVEKAPLASAECDVTAFNERGSSVGRLTRVVFGPNTKNQRLTTLAVEIPTPIGRATSAKVATCRITRTR